jgi:hypothetical protein
MDGVVDAIVTRVGEILFESFPPQAEDPIERLRLFFFRRVKTIFENPHISQLLLSDHLAQAGGPAQARRLDEFKQRSQAFVVDCLRKARVAGLSANGMSAEAGAVMVIGAILALSHATPRVVGKAQCLRLSEEVWAGIERMIRCEPNVTNPRVRRKSQRRS